MAAAAICPPQPATAPVLAGVVVTAFTVYPSVPILGRLSLFFVLEFTVAELSQEFTEVGPKFLGKVSNALCSGSSAS